jgi:type II secretory pathway component PulL
MSQDRKQTSLRQNHRVFEEGTQRQNKHSQIAETLLPKISKIETLHSEARRKTRDLRKEARVGSIKKEAAQTLAQDNPDKRKPSP